MEEYIIDVCISKMKAIAKRIQNISSRLHVSYGTAKFFGDDYYYFNIDYIDYINKNSITKTTSLSIFEHHLYVTSVDDIMLNVIKLITKDLLTE